MNYICKTVVIVHVDGKRKEIAQGAPLPDGVDDDAMDDLIRLGAIERSHAVLGTADAAQGEASDAGAATDAPPPDAAKPVEGEAPFARTSDDAKPRSRSPKAD